MGVQLPEREVTAEYIETGCGECFSEGNQQRGVVIFIGVDERQCITGRGGCAVNETAYGHFAEVLAHERFCWRVSHETIIAEIAPRRSTGVDIVFDNC
jgi:hypothetical protein